MTPKELQEIAAFVKKNGVASALATFPKARATIEAVGVTYGLLPKGGLRWWWDDNWDALLGTEPDDDLATKFGVPVETVALRRRALGLFMQPGSKYSKLNDDAWLHQKYVTERRSTTEIAMLAGAKTANSAQRALLRTGITLRKRGLQSRLRKQLENARWREFMLERMTRRKEARKRFGRKKSFTDVELTAMAHGKIRNRLATQGRGRQPQPAVSQRERTVTEQTVTEMRTAGFTLKKISDDVGITVGRVQRLLKRRGTQRGGA